MFQTGCARETSQRPVLWWLFLSPPIPWVWVQHHSGLATTKTSIELLSYNYSSEVSQFFNYLELY